MKLLNKGLKYNLHHKHYNWIKTLAIEADTAVNQINITEQAYMRQLVANKLQKLINQEKTKNNNKKAYATKQAKYEKQLVWNIKKKINENDLIITKADKGNTLIIMKQDEYNQKTTEFMVNNNYIALTQDQTKKQQRTIRNTINRCTNIIPKKERWKFININPEAPMLHSTIKLHKPEKPIRPVVNWMNSPGYKFAKHLNKQLRDTLLLPYIYNVENTHHLMEQLINLTYRLIPKYAHLILRTCILKYHKKNY
jgi:hypothetical protein